MAKIKNNLPTISLGIVSLLVYAYLCYLMVAICLQYFPWNTEQHFLLLKQDVVNTQPWQTAFKIHVISSSFVLIAGFTQFFRVFRTRFPRIHRWSGWLYLITILGFSLPSGLILAFSAAGGLSTQISFVLLSSLWAITTLSALYFLLKKRWILHRDWMIRSFALSLSALSLRTWKMGLYTLQPYFDWLTPVHIYQLESWLGWVVNLIIAEIIIFKLHLYKTEKP
ncbi:DUF2306 domain-containing protein [Acinetobacter bereziniae]|uniref:DUF2306 domain-containing protein n=1 Tax=Acinetobacter bereziniae TaxID=106648 RepID=UPI0005739A64|nr:DUF2306 domain-containing protein [Acinetobacter bereziniae]MDM1786504.1 DUF2306 domain-containing protein [Acinetobacter bereziniae]CEI54747.1 membrane protein, putative [Acinetobacter bereziniae]